jgi:hypothetical protein
MGDVQRITAEEYLELRPPSGRKRPRPSRAGTGGRAWYRCAVCGVEFEASIELAQRHANDEHGGGRLELLLDGPGGVPAEGAVD